MTQATLTTVSPIVASNVQRKIGLLSALATVIIWAGYFLSMRFGTLASMQISELAILRYSVPGLILLPIFIKAFHAYRKASIIYILGIVSASGFFFFWLSAVGIQNTGVAHASTLIPGTLPIFVTLIAVIVFKQSFPKARIWGFMWILTGVTILVISTVGQTGLAALFGQFQLLACALLWSIFTVCVRQSGLKPLQVSALVTVPNGLGVFIWVMITQPELNYASLSFTALSTQIFVQTFLVGILSGLFYSSAINKLGAEKTAAIGAFTPVVATLLAIFFLQESLELIPTLGLCFTVVGVVVASRHKTA